MINLDRSTERWQDIEVSAADAGVEVTRVPGVDGAAVPVNDWLDVDHRRFARSHGRTILPGEYGCYRSHLAALQAVIASGEPVAVICEDDITVKPEAPAAVTAVLGHRPDLHVLKLANHRIRGFVSHGGDGLASYGRCIHGPQGSAACYAVTREGATLLLSALQTMWLPWDIALERGWDTGARIYTTP
ncbi:glycosyltransferase family 25 protein, partial [Aurantimonas sp. A2-1-M11]|uniref:glycosyltransferase family 25 protein n=1 Tax=Aurantimonas sp. A2-1-M11 TaxID=3113712 RepID=UPI002F92C45A